MKYKIAFDVLTETTKCRNDFACLSDKSDCLCDVADIIDDSVIKIYPTSINRDCDYRLSFAFSDICTCPIRKELYRQYNI